MERKPGRLDRIWWLLNKKPPTRMTAYTAAVTGWLFVGILVAVSLLTTAVAWPWGLLLFLAPLVYAILEIRKDQGSGMLELVYERKYKEWETRVAGMGLGATRESKEEEHGIRGIRTETGTGAGVEEASVRPGAKAGPRQIREA